MAEPVDPVVKLRIIHSEQQQPKKHPNIDVAAQVGRFEFYERNVETEPLIPVAQALGVLADELEAQAEYLKSEIPDDSPLQITVMDLCYYAGWLRGRFCQPG